MAVKVIVCGDQNGDYEFLVNSVERKRLFNEEILELQIICDKLFIGF